MKRKEAIEQIKSHISYAEFCARYWHNDRDVEKAYDDIEAFRMAIEALQAKDDWIPCSKGLPDIGEEVLTTDIYGDVDIETLMEVPRSDNFIWEDEGGFYTDFEDIIAWMPKPKPYKSDNE